MNEIYAYKYIEKLMFHLTNAEYLCALEIRLARTFWLTSHHVALHLAQAVKGFQQPVLCFKQTEISNTKCMWRTLQKQIHQNVQILIRISIKTSPTHFRYSLVWLASSRLRSGVSFHRLLFTYSNHFMLTGRQTNRGSVLDSVSFKMRYKNFFVQLVRWIFKTLNH